jgi:hypothetical protein
MGSTKVCLGTTRHILDLRLKGRLKKKKKKYGVITIWAHIMLGLKLVVPAVSAPIHACVVLKTHILIWS